MANDCPQLSAWSRALLVNVRKRNAYGTCTTAALRLHAKKTKKNSPLADGENGKHGIVSTSDADGRIQTALIHQNAHLCTRAEWIMPTQSRAFECVAVSRYSRHTTSARVARTQHRLCTTTAYFSFGGMHDTDNLPRRILWQTKRQRSNDAAQDSETQLRTIVNPQSNY